VTFDLQIDPQALAEADTAARWYEEHRPGYGDRFREEVDRVLSRITDHPTGYQILNGQYRRAFTRRFPFVVVYRVRCATIHVVGVMPTPVDPAAVAALLQARSN